MNETQFSHLRTEVEAPLSSLRLSFDYKLTHFNKESYPQYQCNMFKEIEYNCIVYITYCIHIALVDEKGCPHKEIEFLEGVGD